MQQEAPRSLGDRVVNLLEQFLQHLSDSPSNSDDDDDVGVAELIVDVHVLDRSNYAEDADVRLHEVELPPVVAEQTSNFRRRRRRRSGAGGVDARSLIPKRRSCSDEVLCKFRSRSALRVRERTPP